MLFGVAVSLGLGAAGLAFSCSRTVQVSVRLDRPVHAGVQVYYCSSCKEPYAESRCEAARPVGDGTVMETSLPVSELAGLRLDFGSSPGAFALLGVKLNGVPLIGWSPWSFSPDLSVRSSAEGGALALFSDKSDPYMMIAFPEPVPACWQFRKKGFAALFLAVAFVVWWMLWLRLRQVEWVAKAISWLGTPRWTGLSSAEWAFLVLLFAYYSLWIFQPYNFSPDEAMRFWVTDFLFKNGRLPFGTEAISTTWGTSYAHLPTMFNNVFGALFMRIASVFTADERTLLLSARMVGVVCVSGVVYWLLRTARLLFSSSVRWLMVCLVAFLPQFAYIGSYLNNDSAALLGMSMVLYAWVSSLRKRWTYGNATALSVGMAICLVAYYNSYSWGLFSILMFPVGYFCRNGRKGFVKMGSYVVLLTLVLGSYLFLRHFWLYGDLLGFATVRDFALQYADPAFRPGVRLSLRDGGVSLWQMLVQMSWLKMTVGSFIGWFGYMQYPIQTWCYFVYCAFTVVFSFGAAGWALTRIRQVRFFNLPWVSFAVSLIGCIVVTICLSGWYSYTYDFQPQGRYCFPALLAISTVMTKGADWLLGLIPFSRARDGLVLGLCVVLALVSLSAYSVFLRSI